MSGRFNVEACVDEVTALVRTASRRSLDWYRKPLAVENKADSGFDPVTEADRAVEDELRAALTELFPGHAIFGEERGATGSGRFRWVIDPIDGTRAFISGQPMWGTLVGLQVDGEPIAGWMHQPAVDETHVATPRGGRVIFGDPAASAGSVSRPLRSSGCADLASAILLSTHPDMFAPGAEADGFARLGAAVRLVRYSGDCANYGLLAEGQVDLVVENQLAPYDIIPMIPIVRSSGALITNAAGGLPVDGGYVIAAATAQLHDAARRLLIGPGHS